MHYMENLLWHAYLDIVGYMQQRSNYYCLHYQWLYSNLLGGGRFPVSWFYMQSAGLFKHGNSLCLHKGQHKITPLRGLSPRANYTDLAAAACRWSWCQICEQRVPRGKPNWSLRPYSRISRPEPLLFLPSSSLIVPTRLSEPHSRSTTSQKIGSTGNRTRTSGSVARNSDH
jgi:hypothetical protein